MEFFNSADETSKQVFNSACFLFNVGAIVSDAHIVPAPRDIFDLPYKQDGSPDEIFWKTITTHLGPWIKSASAALRDTRTAKTTNLCTTIANVVETAGDKNKPNRARDTFIAIGLSLLEARGLSLNIRAEDNPSCPAPYLWATF